MLLRLINVLLSFTVFAGVMACCCPCGPMMRGGPPININVPPPQPIVEAPKLDKKNPQGDGDAKQDQDAIQGEWTVVSAVNRGKAMPAAESVRHSFSFDGDTFKVLEGGEVNAEEKFTLDPTKNPKQIDLSKDGKTKLAIYELKGDDLKLSIDDLGKGRPNNFAASKSANLWVLKRKK